MAIKEVDPISRIEGHLGVKLTTNDTTHVVEEADVHGNLWRGFENFLIGRDPNDAITFTQRICGVCPVLCPMARPRPSRLRQRWATTMASTRSTRSRTA